MIGVDPMTWSKVGVLGTRAVVMATGGRGTTETGAIHTASSKLNTHCRYFPTYFFTVSYDNTNRWQSLTVFNPQHVILCIIKLAADWIIQL